MTNQNRIISTIRTGIPALVGLILAALSTRIPAVADVIVWVQENAGMELSKLLSALATALVIAGYYALVRWLASYWPWLEAFLGSTKRPVDYVSDRDLTANVSNLRGIDGADSDRAVASFMDNRDVDQHDDRHDR